MLEALESILKQHHSGCLVLNPPLVVIEQEAKETGPPTTEILYCKVFKKGPMRHQLVQLSNYNSADVTEG